MRNSTARKRVMAILESMPESASVSKLVVDLCLRLKIEQRLKDARSGDTISHAEAKRRLRRWLSR
ncbi:MAG: hypothetical protein HZB38_04635 [Planctomycetes bacterium]|nr:hypothetical protein [Planctomycetota bacterium]